MTDEAITDMVFVKNHYPGAYIIPTKTWAGATHFTVFDAHSQRYISPTTFTQENAWKHAAQRIRKSMEASQ